MLEVNPNAALVAMSGESEVLRSNLLKITRCPNTPSLWATLASIPRVKRVCHPQHPGVRGDTSRPGASVLSLHWTSGWAPGTEATAAVRPHGELAQPTCPSHPPLHPATAQRELFCANSARSPARQGPWFSCRSHGPTPGHSPPSSSQTSAKSRPE